MITRNMILLDIVEQYPETEAIFREYDSLLGTCIMCSHLFQSIEDIEKEKNVSLDELYNRLLGYVSGELEKNKNSL